MARRTAPSRRDFLRTAAASAAAAVGITGAPGFTFAQDAGGKTLVKVFQRGGADGLHLFPLWGDPIYYDHRPNIGIEAPLDSDADTAVDLGTLGEKRGMNPNLAAMAEIWDTGRMLLAPSCSIAEGNRSHFDCQRWIGTGLRNNIIDGYLNRYLQAVNATDHPLRGASLGKGSTATEMRGPLRTPVVDNAGNYNLTNPDFCGGSGCADNRLTEAMMEIASHEVEVTPEELRLREEQITLIDTIAEVQAAGTDYSADANGLEYSNSSLGKGLKLVAQLLKAGVPLSVASLDWNIGWDTHSNQIADTGNRFSDQNKGYHRGMTQGASDFLCFWRDTADMRDDVVVLVGTEFGRTVKENGTFGTDHGHGGAWFAFGGPTQGGVYGDVESLAEENLMSGRYMPNHVDYRDIVAEIMVRHMGLPQNLLANVLPQHSFSPLGAFGRLA